MTRIASLDGLRASSILFVLFGHLAWAAGFHSELTDIYATAGVRLFFIISGYLITTLMLREIERNGTLSIGNFYIRRAWRILPAAYAYLAIVTWIEHQQFSWTQIGLAWGYLTSYAPAFGPTPWDLSHLWSLSVEEQFYFVWPLVVALGLIWPKQLAWAAVVIAPLVRHVHHVTDRFDMLLTFDVMDSIAVGCLLAIYAPKVNGFIANRAWLGLVWPLALLMPALVPEGNYPVWVFSPLPQLLSHSAWTIFNFLAAIGILWAINAKPGVLNHWLPVWVGTMSYSLYLWQEPFMNPQAPISLWLRLPLAFACAALSYYAIERPVLALREWTRKRQEDARKARANLKPLSAPAAASENTSG